MEVTIIKKDGTKEDFNFDKIEKAITKSADRVLIKFSKEDWNKIRHNVLEYISKLETKEISIETIHNVVECTLRDINSKVSKSYKDYRNYKKDFIHMMDDVYQKSLSIRYIGDKENSNTDSALVATKRCLIFNELNKELYKKFFMTAEELQACRDGYIYVHDMSARLDTMNCCLCDVGNVMRGGFEMGNVWYNEPKSLDTAFDVMGDIILSVAAQQYGGFTVSEVDKILSTYAEKSYNKYIDEYFKIIEGVCSGKISEYSNEAKEYALNKIKRDFEQGWQGIEMKLNTVGSSRGDYPFVTMTFGLATDIFGKMASKTFLSVHERGQGKDGNKKPVLFPKLVFLYDKNLHGENCINEDVFEAGVKCSMTTMYPDWLSLTGEGYVSEIYKKYKKVISPMGCVDGKEIVAYKIDEILYVESFETMWKRICQKHENRGQTHKNDENRYVYLSDDNVKIYDTEKGFVKVNLLIRNVQDDWYDITLTNGVVVRVTSDHPFQTCRGVVKARKLSESDIMKFNNKKYSVCLMEEFKKSEIVYVGVESKKKVSVRQYSYDVSTESEHFEFSGLYSHNCRAFLSPYYEKGGFKPLDENDTPVFVGRFNIGAVSLHLPMILAKSREENKDFYEVLNYYLEMIRKIHIRTYKYLGKLKASTNPIVYCEGGFYGGNLKPSDCIEPLLKPMTASFGITALNELQQLYNGKSIAEDGQFVLEVMEYINKKVNEFKDADGHLYAIYGTPAENLCGLQIKQFRKKYGIIKNVSDKEYVSNSFHCHVSEDITPIQKQDLEERFWNLFNGGKIQYVRYPINYNVEAVKTLIKRAMDKGFYEGVNLSLAYCNDCGYQQLEMDICPKCQSKNLTKIDRMNGYLSYSRVNGDTRLNSAKMAEIKDRKSM